ncbi:XF1762 family protein [Streptomyces sp. NPDC018019]|uniref:XF1762 family protein n=1 Tax=Streptomyces sp. NPDC018019 TaxID=3365030 RepID=UPI0037AD1830
MTAQGTSAERSRLHCLPISFRQACTWIAEHHRHNKPPRGHKFSIAAADEEGTVHGVAMVGRPVARAYDNGRTLEVNRTCTDGASNVNSFLYAASWRIAREMGYLRVVTYTQGDEPGTSLVAAGWRVIGKRPARGSWQESTKAQALVNMRDPKGNGGVPRKVREVLAW